MLDAVFATTVGAEILLGVCLVATLASPHRRVWPPPGRASWQFWVIWVPTVVAAGGIVWVGIVDWNTGPLDHGLRLPIGAGLVLGGLLLARWGITTLGRHATLGLGGPLVESGPYRWTRNPQYVGDIAALLGWAIACNSLRTWIVCLLGAAWFALAPFTEEPWLRGELGEGYDAYRRRVPRFLGRRRATSPHFRTTGR